MTSADNKYGLTVGILTILGIVIVIMVARWFLSFLLNHWMLASAGAVLLVFLFFYLVVSTQKS
jgi:membrane protein YdbS with pleckstrin-like domain